MLPPEILVRFNRAAFILVFQFLGIFVPFNVYAQCRIEILADSSNVDSIFICRGESVNLSIVGEYTLVTEDFNASTVGSTWNYCNPNVLFHASCDAANPNPYLWYGPLTVPDRILETHDMDLTKGGVIQFDLKFAIQNGPIGCEGPDEMLEGVSLQYSNDSGSNWNDITYFCPNGTFLPANPWVQSPLTMFPTQFTNWANYSFVIPAPAMTSHTRIRWIQQSSSYFNGHHDDNWGLDNIRIFRSIMQEILWSTGSTAVSPPPVLPQQTTTYVAYVINSLNPSDTLARDSITVVVLPAPITQINGDTVICLGETTQLLATGNYLFLWNTGDTSASLLLTPLTNQCYSLTATNEYGCQSMKSANIIVNPLPVPITHGDSICPGDSAYLFAGGGLLYHWNNGYNGPDQLIQAFTTAVYTVTVTDENGCKDTSSAILKVFSPPVPEITHDTVICYGDEAHLIAGGGDHYLWNNGSVKHDIYVEPVFETQYQVTVTDVNMCSSSASTTVFVNPFHEVEITSSRDTICHGSFAILNAIGGSHFEWSNGRIDPEITVYPNYSTIFQVDASDVFMGTWCHVMSFIDLEVKECENFFFPNAILPKGYNPIFKPIGEYQQINHYSLVIYDRLGKLVFESKDPGLGWNGTINGNYAPGGNYIYRVHFEKTLNGDPYDRTGTLNVIY